MSLRGGAEQSLACRLVTRPVHPLMAIDGAEVAPSRGEIWVIQNSRFESLRTDIVPGFAAITVERPVGPDAPALCDQRTDVGVAGQEPQQFAQRSEEHTSELQSLMRISYAVFCLKKKT